MENRPGNNITISSVMLPNVDTHQAMKMNAIQIRIEVIIFNIQLSTNFASSIDTKKIGHHFNVLLT